MRSHFFQRPFVLLLFLICGASVRNAAAQAPGSYQLTLQEAIQLGLKANLSVLAAEARVGEAQGTYSRRLSAAFLPRVTAQTYANLHNLNLQAFGLEAPGVPQVIGPLSNYDIRFYAQQNVLDLGARHEWKAGEQSLEASRQSYADARDMVVGAVAELYLNALSAAARTAAAQSRVNDAEALWKLARDRHDAGEATGVDVLRAEVELANEKQGLLVAQNQYEQAILVLARNLGLRPGTSITLTDKLRFQPLVAADSDSLVSSALAARSDYLSLSSQRRALVEEQAANHARYYPKVSVNGNFGGIGRSIGSIQGTGLIQGQIDFTLFDRDREGAAQELTSRIKGIDDQMADARRAIEQDVREALLNLESAAKQVSVAREGQDLARRELDLTQDRFAQGTANNVEVVTAQDELARAQENYIVAVANHEDAKFALARALGDTEKNITEFERRQ